MRRNEDTERKPNSPPIHRSLKARGKAPPVMMRMQSETIAEGSEPSSMGSLAEAGGCQNNHDEADNSDAKGSSDHSVAAASDVFVEDVDNEGKLGQIGFTLCLENKLYFIFIVPTDTYEHKYEFLTEKSNCDDKRLRLL